MSGRSCPACGVALSGTEGRCPNCRQTLLRSAPPPDLPKLPDRPKVPSRVSLSLPRYVPDARYCFGKTWTSGCLWVIAEGIFFLSESDGYRAPESCGALQPSADVAKVGNLGFFAPAEHIEKINHRTPINAYVVISAQKVPVRLSSEGWAALDSYAALAGIPLE